MNAATSLEDARLDHLAARTLVTGPPGSGKSKLALDLFDDAVRRHGPDAALIVFPTYGQVEHAKRLAISRRGDRPDVRGLLDVSYVTFTSLGERSSLGDGVADGFRVRGLPSRRAIGWPTRRSARATRRCSVRCVIAPASARDSCD